jgi:uncharacterized protein (DUF1499 family)
MKLWKILLILCLGLCGASVAILALLSVFARRPDHLGVVEGRLVPCPDKPNCVCSQDEDERHAIAPLHYTGSATEAVGRLKKVLAAQPRTRIVTAHEEYLHAECTSRLFRFVDDVEFLIDDARKVIHFRSASRAGRSDMGVNRERMESIRKAFAGLSPSADE